MIKKLRFKFIAYAMVSVLLLLVIILGTINIVNFSLLADDADKITEIIASNPDNFNPNNKRNNETNPFIDNEINRNDNGFNIEDPNNPNSIFNPNKQGPMGPTSPEVRFTTRYFTVQFDSNNKGQIKTYNISAISENEAIEWATSLLGKTNTGWSKTTYRYRIYKNNGTMFVTIIDQGREMLPSLRILQASIIGTVIGLICSFVVLIYVSKIVVKPIEQANRKQKRFITNASQELKNPITTIDLNNKSIENKFGICDETISNSNQILKLTTLTNSLNTLTILDEFEEIKTENVNLSILFDELKQPYLECSKDKNIKLELNIENNLNYKCDKALISKLFVEIIENAIKFTLSKATVNVNKVNDRIIISSINDSSDIPQGQLDMVFERFFKLDNAKDKPGTGIGLSIVKEIVEKHNGRIFAEGRDNNFIIKIEL